jgi:nitrite reductase/ring-hydroxylating ferredoxin subunit
MTSNQWVPVAVSQDIRPAENIVAGFSGVQEVALWRSQEGLVQAWENRCPHRGMRFTLGRIVGGRLSCAYHGWEFEAGGGLCAAIPAHPGMAAPKNACATTYPVVEAQGMVWVSLPAQEGPAGSVSVLPTGDAPGQFCRILSVRTSATHVTDVLGAQGFIETAPCVLAGTLDEQVLTVFVNEVSEELTLLHVWMASGLSATAIHAVMASLQSLRTSIESAKAS